MPGKKLLVADDSLTIQKVIRLALSNEGYEIQTVSDGNDAVQQISLFRPDAVLIDISLPGKSAFEVKREINSHGDFEEVRFILMSSAFEQVDEVQVKEVEFHGNLTKPFDPAHLRALLVEALDQVTAKRLEKTSILVRPSAPPASSSEESKDPPLGSPTPSFKTERVETDSEWKELLNANHLPLMEQPLQEPLDGLWEPEKEGSPPFIQMPSSQGSQFNSEPSEKSSLSSILSNTMDYSNTTTANALDDIQELTNSTMQAVDEFQWSVSEPTLKPLAGMLEQDGAQFTLDSSDIELAPPFSPSTREHLQSPGEMTLSRIQQPTKTLDIKPGDSKLSIPSLDEMMDPPEFFSPLNSEFQENISHSQFPIRETKSAPQRSDFIPPGVRQIQIHEDLSENFHENSKNPFQTSSNSNNTNPSNTNPSETSEGPQSAAARTAQLNSSSARSSVDPASFASAPSPVLTQGHQAFPMSSFSEAQIEAIIRTQVESTLQKLAQKILPEVAERVIKQEIHRLLSEQ